MGNYSDDCLAFLYNMKKFSMSLIGVGFDESFFKSVNCDSLQFYRKGDVWRKRTGQTYEDNIARLSINVTIEEGYSEALNRLMDMLDKNPSLLALTLNCREVEVQFSIAVEEYPDFPWLHLDSEQVKYLSKINAEIDVNISW
jgi:hypothetical protein